MKVCKLDWVEHKDVIKEHVVLEVDGSVNKNPGVFGVVGIYDPQTKQITTYKYRGNRLTNHIFFNHIFMFYPIQLTNFHNITKLKLLLLHF